MEDESINVDDLCIEIEQRYQNLCALAAKGAGVTTMDEMADIVGSMSDLAKVVSQLTGEVMKLQDEVKSLKSK